MGSPAHLCMIVAGVPIPSIHHKPQMSWRSPNLLCKGSFSGKIIEFRRFRCTNPSARDAASAPVAYVPEADAESEFLKTTPNIFETMTSSKTADSSVRNTEEQTQTSSQPLLQPRHFEWLVWVLGPTLLLATGMVPTLWLPISSVFMGPNIASLLSLTGLDCIYNLGASLFLLLADFCARCKDTTDTCGSKPPFTYQLWNMVSNIMGFIIPLTILFGSSKGFLQPQLSFISYSVLIGPYLLLLLIQILMEILTWHWQSPVWLVTPVVYESYRILQLMRGLKLGTEISVPSWMMHTTKGLVCLWVLVLGIQLMRVAWYAGFTVRSLQQHSHAFPDHITS